MRAVTWLLALALVFMVWGALRGNAFRFVWAVIAVVCATTALQRQRQP